ncbi:MAG: ParB N-terminal domain-containing protein [Christensenellales bacterium]|jgi:hypothetical protein
MEIINRKVKDLIPYDKNPRKNDEAVKYVKASIEQFGFKVPIVIDADGVIVAGHTRLKAAKELGMKEVPCIVADDLTPEQIKAYRLADNMTASKSEWDIELLNTELLDLEANFDMADFGFEIYPPTGIHPDDFDDGFTLKDGDREPFQTMSFTFSDTQADDVRRAVTDMKQTAEYKGYTGANENSNGNALWLVVAEWLRQRT